MTFVLSSDELLCKDLNVTAKPFIPDYIREEEIFFNKLEQEFVRVNKWIFDEEECMLKDDSNNEKKDVGNIFK
jgi:hypothetical protein